MARALGAHGLVLQVAVLETAMPTMITAGALMMAYGVASELAAAFVSWGLILSLAHGTRLVTAGSLSPLV